MWIISFMDFILVSYFSLRYSQHFVWIYELSNKQHEDVGKEAYQSVNLEIIVRIKKIQKYIYIFN